MRAITILFILIAHLGMAQVINLDPPVSKAVYSDTASFSYGIGGSSLTTNYIGVGDTNNVMVGTNNLKFDTVNGLYVNGRIVSTAIYIGEWRIRVEGNNFITEKLELGVWVTKQTINP